MTKKPNKQKPMTPSIFFYDENGTKKYIYGRYYVETIVNAIYKDQTEVQVGRHSLTIKNQFRSDEEWFVEVGGLA